MDYRNSVTRDYTPIACRFYDVFEIAIMRGERLRIRWVGYDGLVQETLSMPLDLTTKERAEWLVARNQQGETLRLRLDRIESAEPVPI